MKQPGGTLVDGVEVGVFGRWKCRRAGIQMGILRSFRLKRGDVKKCSIGNESQWNTREGPHEDASDFETGLKKLIISSCIAAASPRVAIVQKPSETVRAPKPALELSINPGFPARFMESSFSAHGSLGGCLMC